MIIFSLKKKTEDMANYFIFNNKISASFLLWSTVTVVFCNAQPNEIT